jgi:F0F1-type ATP synthase assembly protein I
MDDKPTPREMGYYFALAQTGIEMVVPAAAGFYVDDWLGTTPWITIVAAVFGFAGALTHIVFILRQKERDEQKDKNKPP